MDPSTPLTYTRLPAGRVIRVVTIQPAAKQNAPLRCTLEETCLDKDPIAYEALSYVWGSSGSNDSIICDGQTLKVTTNCLAAMRSLRRRKVPRKLWIDAICIDQTSIPERNSQVKLMGDVYALSQRVLIWLGNGDILLSLLMLNLKFYCSGKYSLIHLALDYLPKLGDWPSLQSVPVADWFSCGKRSDTSSSKGYIRRSANQHRI